MELYYKEERDRDLFRAYNEALKSLGKMAVNVPREQIVRHVVYSIAPRFYISYEEARRNVKRIFKGYSPRCVSSTRTEMYNDLAKSRLTMRFVRYWQKNELLVFICPSGRLC